MNPKSPSPSLIAGLIRISLLLMFAYALLVSPAMAQKADRAASDELVREASRAYSTTGKKAKALTLLEKAIKADPDNDRAYRVRVKIYKETNDLAKAEADFTKLLSFPKPKMTYHQDRGVVRFFLSKFKESIADFDAFIAAEPNEGPDHWQRGIALYYDDKFKAGRKQFEDHQKVNSRDVENAVWHFLCVARLEGPKAARKLLIPIVGDTRVPMAQVHNLYSGKGKMADILEAAGKTNLGANETEKAAIISNQLCYAHLYIALFYEANKRPVEALKHLKLAAVKYAQPHYMGQVARVHYELRSKKKAGK